MQSSWWRDAGDLKDEQQAIVNLAPKGRYLVLGPPGSGKTNLLLLRLKWLSVAGQKNVLFLTLGRSLAEFIKTGVGPKKIIDEDQIRTYMKWLYQMTADNVPALLKGLPTEYDKRQQYFAENIDEITKHLPNHFYDAIVVDEVQDIGDKELAVLTRLTPRIMVAGDIRQSIYAGNGVGAAIAAGFERKDLQFHYRIGRAICEIADKVYPPDEGQPPLLQRCQYDEKKSPSQAKEVQCSNLKEQCDKLVENVRLQLKAYPGEAIGVLLPTFKHSVFDTVQGALEKADFSDLVEYHSDHGREFSEEKRVYVLTCHSAKGMEFRAVNLMAAERMASGPLGRRTLIFTAITRAKTSLLVYFTGKLPPALATAFAKETVPELKSLF